MKNFEEKTNVNMRTNISELSAQIKEHVEKIEDLKNATITMHENTKKAKYGMASVNVFILMENKKKISMTIYIVEREKSTIVLVTNNLNGDIIFSNTNIEKAVEKSYDYAMQFIENCVSHSNDKKEVVTSKQ